MRVLLVSHRYPPDSIAGVERYTHLLARALVQAGDTVQVVTRRATPTHEVPRLLREEHRDGIVVHRLVGGDAGLDTFLDYHERLEQLFDIALLEAIPDVVHINHLRNLSPRFIPLARRYGTAVVLTLHDFYMACPLAHLRKLSGALCQGPDGGRECARTCFAYEGAAASLRWTARAAYYRRLLNTPERVICPSHHVGAYFAGFGVATARLRIIPNGIESGQSGPLPLPAAATTRRRNGPLTLAFLGAVVPDKGPHLILEALRLARLRQAKLLICGPVVDTEYAHSLRTLAGSIPGLILRFYGRYSPEELPDLLADADCVVVPSLVPETFSLTAYEALALGVPIIVSRLGALPEAVDEGENGFTFAHDRPATLAALLQRLVEDAALLPRLCAGARRSPVVSATNHMEAVRAIYAEAQQERRRLASGHWGEQQELEALYAAVAALGFVAPTTAWMERP